MHLSPSTVPSDSNALAGIFPVGASVATAQGPGLAEPAGFAELMAALAPAPTVSVAATQQAAQSRPATLVAGGVAVAALRSVGLAQPREGAAADPVEGADVASVSIAGKGSDAAPESPSKRTESAAEEEQPLERPHIREPRRSLHEPVVGLETMVVPQLPLTPTSIAEEGLEDEPAELDTEEAPLEEDGASGEDTAEEIAVPAARDVATASGPSFAEIAPQPEVARSPLPGRRTAAPTQSGVGVPSAEATSSEATPASPQSQAASAAPATELPRDDARVGQGLAKPVAGDVREASGASVPLPVEISGAAPVAAREVPSQMQMTAAETTPTKVTPSGAAMIAQPIAAEALARGAAAMRPVATTTVAPRAASASAGEAAGEEMLPADSAGNPATMAAPALPIHREAASRAAAPRVAAAYATREKFAAERAAPAGERSSPAESAKLYFLNADGESLNSGDGGVGIDVAESKAVMPAISSPTTFASLAPVAVSVMDVAPSQVQEATEVSAPEAVSNAEQAVEVVLHAIDTAADREQKVVKLEFSVGDAELSVRVELAADEVRTTFRTESPELRAALAQEWQSVAGDSVEQGGVRLAPAVISDKENAPSTSADANSQRQERQAARQEEAAASAQQTAARSLLRSISPADAPAAATPAFRALAPAGTAQRLHLFA